MAEPVRVIVIDDEEGMREGMRRILVKEGFNVDLAPDGESGLELLKQNVYDLALVDLKMPGIDGFKVTECINRIYGNKIVVVIVSALATVEAAVEVTREGAFDFLVKPFTPADLIRVVRRAEKQLKLITERERYLSELSRERSLSRQIINSVQDGLVVLNINNKPVLINPRAEYFLNVKYREEMTFDELVPLKEILPRLGEGAPVKEVTARVVELKIGNTMFRLRIMPYLREQEMCGTLIVMSDITEERQNEENKNRFIRMVAHELNSPLAAIINYINVIQSGMFDGKLDKIHEMLERSKIRGEALLELIRDLLFLNKRDSGKVEKSIESLDLKEILAGHLDFFKVQAERADISLCLEAEKGNFRVKADRGDMERVFVNLISNGIKYNRSPGSLTVRLKEVDHDVTVKIEDTGIGMTDQEMENLFQEFYRVKNEKTAGISGTGLGLATAKRVLAEYNGRIKVESEKGRGTTFTVTLPCNYLRRVS